MYEAPARMIIAYLRPLAVSERAAPALLDLLQESG
jgi:hypothetical protein